MVTRWKPLPDWELTRHAMNRYIDTHLTPRGIGVVRLAAAMGVETNTIYRLRRGQQNWTERQRRRLMRAVAKLNQEKDANT